MTLLVLLLGIAVGVLVGLLGIGGGVVLVPALVYVLHLDQHLAQGTSLLILLPPVGLGALRILEARASGFARGNSVRIGNARGWVCGRIDRCSNRFPPSQGAVQLLSDLGGVLALAKSGAAKRNNGRH